MKFIVGAYAASPSSNGWNREIETRFYEGLKTMPAVGGLEVPFMGSAHPHDPEWFLDQLIPQWDYVLTAIPGVMITLGKDPTFGLASKDRDGRKRAIEHTRSMLDFVDKINRRLGRPAVTAVEVHSAPTLGGALARSSVEDFALSLTEIRSWDWQGAEICVEHCDSYTPAHLPAKGFLTIQDEITAIRASAGTTPVGSLINWGRSAIDEREAKGPARHLSSAREAGVLNGLIFSGCTIDNALYGHWSDSHAPFDTAGSLLTRDRLMECVRIAQPSALRVFGFKMQALPKSMAVEERLRFIDANARVLQSVL